MRCSLLTFLFLAFGPIAHSQLVIAAASDLQPVMTEISSQFQKATGIKVKLSFGSSGNFYAQIQKGAPYDLFFSADMDYPQKLEAAGLTESGSLYEYGEGKIVIWTPRESRLDLNAGLTALATPEVHRIAIANPAHAPYGRAAEAALKRAGLWEKVQNKLVLGENIAQTAQFVQSGNADVGLLALSLALSPAMKGKGNFREVSPELYPSLRQAAVVLRSSEHKALARRFMQFIQSPASVSLLARYGFSSPEVAH